MATYAEPTGKTDRNRIDFNDVSDVVYWMEQFHVSADDLLLAVERARSSKIDEVRQALRKR